VTLVEQWRRIEAELPSGWAEARLSLLLADEGQTARAASLLGPASPGRSGATFLFGTSRRGGAVGPEAVRRLLRRLDEARIRGTLAVVSTAEAPEPESVVASTLEEAWRTTLATLPPDWSDLLCEVEVPSSDQIARVALLFSPLNPSRQTGRLALRFRCARRFGYGASAEMVRRCFARADAEGLRGQVRVLRALSDTHNVATQGPVWQVEGKSM